MGNCWPKVPLPRLINHNLCGKKGVAKKTLPSFETPQTNDTTHNILRILDLLCHDRSCGYFCLLGEVDNLGWGF